jgi:hypothetical protein
MGFCDPELGFRANEGDASARRKCPPSNESGSRCALDLPGFGSLIGSRQVA